jgi:hypothetical protein
MGCNEKVSHSLYQVAYFVNKTYTIAQFPYIIVYGIHNPENVPCMPNMIVQNKLINFFSHFFSIFLIHRFVEEITSRKHVFNFPH